MAKSQFWAVSAAVNLGGKCEFAASAQRLCQFVDSGHPSVGNCIRAAAMPDDRSEPILLI